MASEKKTTEQLGQEVDKLREQALDLINKASKLIEDAERLEKQIDRRHSQCENERRGMREFSHIHEAILEERQQPAFVC